MIPWKWLLLIDGLTAFIISAGTTLGVVLLEVGKGEHISAMSITGAIISALVVCSNQLRARLALPPPTTAMITAAVAAAAPIAAAAAAPAAARDAAPAAAAAAAPAAAAVVATKQNGDTTP